MGGKYLHMINDKKIAKMYIVKGKRIIEGMYEPSPYDYNIPDDGYFNKETGSIRWNKSYDKSHYYWLRPG